MSATSSTNNEVATSETRQHDTKASTSSSSRPADQSIQAGTRVPCSLVEYCGSGVSNCGYCKRVSVGSEGRQSYDMRAYRLVNADYQEMLDRGWRRSGTYCYHPINNSTCCPNYPISCKALKFRISRSQRRCIQNLNSFLLNGLETNEKIKIDYHSRRKNTQHHTPISTSEIERLRGSSRARHRRFVRSCERKAKLLNISLDEAFNLVKDKYIEKERLLEVLQLEDYLYPVRRSDVISQTGDTSELKPKHCLEIHLYQVESTLCEALREDEHSIIQRYQNVIHKEGLEDWNMTRFRDFLVKTPLFMEPMEGFDHVSEIESSDTRSISIPLDPKNNSSRYLLVKPPELPTYYGTYHCVYQLDGKLIAVGVLDVLPKCVTTVYFFYDPCYGHLNLGIYSGLVEISMVRQLNNHYVDNKCENKLIHYYMGFYVHECLKMRYKTTFKPSYLLCSETCRYVPTEICLSKLTDGKKYARFFEDPDDATHSIYTETVTLNRILEIPIASFVVDSGKMRDYLVWADANLNSEYLRQFVDKHLTQYVRLVGPYLTPRVKLLIR